MPNVLPTIPNDPPQGIQALLDKVYLWNPDVSNELIEKINALMAKLGDAIGVIRPYNEIVAPINQYEPCYYGDGVYVAKNYLAERAEEFNEEDWILIARKEITADEININFAGQEDTVQSAVDTLKTDQDDLGDQVSSIESKIPADASESNQLVTKNEVLALPTFTYKVVNELPETGEEKTIYLVPKPGEGNDVHDEYIWANGAYELIGTTAVDLSGYLPLSGGTLTGDLSFDVDKQIIFYRTAGSSSDGAFIKYDSGVQIGYIYDGIDFVPNFDFSVARSVGINFSPSYRKSATLGDIGRVWSKVYTQKLNNGADITVPTTGGTIALAEDIAESITTKDLTVGTDEGTLNLSIAAGTATIATNNGLDIVAQTKFDTAPTTDDTTVWADVNATALVTKAQVTTALGTVSGGGSGLPDQTGNEGALLTTDGTNPQWTGFVGYVGTDTFDDKKYAIILDPGNKQTSDIKTGHPRTAINPMGDTASFGTNIGGTASGISSISIGAGSRATNSCTAAVGANSYSGGAGSIAVGNGARATNTYSIQLGKGTNDTESTFSVGFGLSSYRLLEADGTIPAERMSSTTGTTGQVLTKTDTGMEWQDSAGGGDALPDQTDNAGKFLTTDGENASWSDKPLVNNADNESSNPYRRLSIGGDSNLSTATWYTAVGNGAYVSGDGGIAIGGTFGEPGGYGYGYGYAAHAEGGNAISIGYSSNAKGGDCIAIGLSAYAKESKSIAIGAHAEATATNAIAIGGYSGGLNRAKATAECAIQLGCGTDTRQDCTNSDANTLKVANNNGNFELMSADGTVPRERMTQLVEVLPTVDNGYTTVKNFGNGYVEITGYASIGTVGAGTGSEVQIDLPAGYTMADANYWVNIAPTSETTMFDFKAEAKARSTTHFMVAYKNEDTTTGLTAAGVYWEVHGMLATTEA